MKGAGNYVRLSSASLSRAWSSAARDGTTRSAPKPCSTSARAPSPTPMTVSPAARPGSDPRRGVRQRDRLRGLNAQVAAGGEQYIRGGARTQPLGANGFGIDSLLDQRREPGELQHGQRAGAGRDDCALHSGTSGGLQVAERPRESRHTALIQRSRHRRGFPPCQAAGGIGVGRAVGSSLGKPDATAVEERMDPFEPRTTVEVLAIVGHPVERDELPPGLRCNADEEVVEDLPHAQACRAALSVSTPSTSKRQAVAVFGSPSMACVTGTGESHGSGRTPAASASRTSWRAVSCRSRTSSYCRCRRSDAGKEMSAARNARSAASSARCQPALIDSSSNGCRGRAVGTTSAAGSRVVRDAPCSRFAQSRDDGSEPTRSSRSGSRLHHASTGTRASTRCASSTSRFE